MEEDLCARRWWFGIMGNSAGVGDDELRNKTRPRLAFGTRRVCPPLYQPQPLGNPKVRKSE